MSENGLALELNPQQLKNFQGVLNQLGQVALSQEFWSSVGAEGESQIKFNISDLKINVDTGAPWRKLEENYKQRKNEVKPGIGILEFDGALHDSIIFDATDKGVEIGSNLIYAARQHIDYDRPFIGLTSPDAMEQTMLDWYEAIQ